MKISSLYPFALFWSLALGQQQQTPFFQLDGVQVTSLLELHRELVQRASITGSEHNVTQYLDGYLRARGFRVELQPVIDGRENILAYLGNNRSTRALLTSHTDTVPPLLPYERRGEEIWGRGTADAKGSVAAQITAVERLRELREIGEGDVALLFVVGEEKNGHGMKAANDLGLAWESVIFGEPTELKLAKGHKGGLAFNVTAKGIAGHSGYPELGRNAIDILVRGLSALSKVRFPGSERYGTTTLNIGQIEGGIAPSVIAENASATVLVRVASNDLDIIKKRIREAISNASPWLDVAFSSYGIGPVPIDSDVQGAQLPSSNPLARPKGSNANSAP